MKNRRVIINTEMLALFISVAALLNGRPPLLTRSQSLAAPRMAALSPDDIDALVSENAKLTQRVAELEALADRTEGLCEVLDDGGGWTSSLRSRASWLLGLLVCQSCSSFVLADNEALLVAHPTVIYFMTMLVGAGGNAGNQVAGCSR